ncbi:hypothetical protein NDU88_010323 [Pleurodeles waltl]|uniref:Uncharacterized protein n=1 Tax=Pleurodeles waltl TaxID=8319 RepID=A0AAV7S307_PLEWA|nr:hypothetical protein NDU88_010323 [Pleurodeles waltl]
MGRGPAAPVVPAAPRLRQPIRASWPSGFCATGATGGAVARMARFAELELVLVEYSEVLAQTGLLLGEFWCRPGDLGASWWTCGATWVAGRELLVCGSPLLWILSTALARTGV